MEQEATKLRQAIHEKGRRQLILGRRAQEIKNPKELKALLNEQKVLGREIVALKADIVRIEQA
ncbi:MAG: hypothetical protein AAB420_02215 [Patescibacteria group bacterium]